MKKTLLILAAVLMMIGCTQQQTKRLVQLPPEQEVEALTPQGNLLALSDLIGHTDYVLVDFWASWCGPCRRLIPVLKDIYLSQPKGRLQILSCSVDQDEKAWRKALAEEEMPWPQIREDKNHLCSDKYNVQFIPFTVLFDKEGKIVAINPDESELEEVLVNKNNKE